MSRRRYDYSVERFEGDPAVLADSLSGLGIHLKPLGDPVHEFRDDDGRTVREIGDVASYADGRIVAWACSNATRAEQVVLLRTAEQVLTEGISGPGAPGWERRTTTTGRGYWITTVFVFADEGDGNHAGVAMRQQQVDEQFALLVAELGDVSRVAVGEGIRS